MRALLSASIGALGLAVLAPRLAPRVAPARADFSQHQTRICLNVIMKEQKLWSPRVTRAALDILN